MRFSRVWYTSLLVLAALPAAALAQTIWTGAGGNTNFSTAGNWNNTTAPANDGTASLTFAGAGAGLKNVIIDVNPSFSANSLTFGGSNPYTISGNPMRIGNGGITSTASADIIFNSPIELTAASTFGNTGGTAKLILTNNSSAIDNRGNALALNAGSGGVRVGGNLVGAGGLTVGGTGVTVLSATGNTYSGGTTINSGAKLLIGDGANNGSLPGNVNVTDNGQIGFNPSSSNLAYSGVISGNGMLSMDGTNALTLLGNHNYTGATVVNSGKLFVNGSLAAGSAVTVNAGGALGGSGTIGGATTITSGGGLFPGNSPGLLTFGSSLTLSAGSIAKFEINGTGRGTSYDAVNVTGLTTYGGTLELAFNSTIANGNTLDLFQLTGSFAGSFSAVTGTGSYVGNFNKSGDAWTLDNNGQLLTFSQTTGDLSFAAGSAIPEPALSGLLAGVAVCGIALRRRKASQTPKT